MLGTRWPRHSRLDVVDDQDGGDVGAECRRRGVNGAVDVEAGHPQLDRQVKLNPPVCGELSGDGGGDGPTVVAEADLEVPGVVRIDAAGGEDVAESFDSVQPLAGTGVAGVDAGREEAIRHGTVTCPTLATGRSAAVAVGTWAAAPLGRWR